MKIRFLVIPILLACFLVVGCGSDKAWRKATVTTYEALGIGIGSSKTVTETLRAQNSITDEQVEKVRIIYNKAVATYKVLGDTLKIASAAENEAQKEVALQNYEKILADFNALLIEITNLINDFGKKKVSLLSVEQWVKGGTL